jgi:hydroxyacylglutathione hydrolase
MHTGQMIVDMNHNLQIIPIPAFKDNYIWLIHNSKNAVIVDPGNAIPVLETLLHLNLTLDTILITHHHHDHIGGVAQLLKSYPDAKTYAPLLEQYPFEHTPIGEADTIYLKSLDIEFSVIDLPGHTLGHVAYYSKNTEDGNLLFCGDTLFGAGCGRLFEGTSLQMYQSLQKLAALPLSTKIYCTHEYTMHNINFALTLEPSNQDLIQRKIDTQKLRDLNIPSLPSTIAIELETNPFLRCDSNTIKSTIKSENASSLEIFSAIRLLRNHY